MLRFVRVIPGVLLLAAIGYAGKLLEQQGLRPFAVGAIGEVAIAVFTLGLVVGAERPFGF
jgi:hypothetical protein